MFFSTTPRHLSYGCLIYVFLCQQVSKTFSFLSRTVLNDEWWCRGLNSSCVSYTNNEKISKYKQNVVVACCIITFVTNINLGFWFDVRRIIYYVCLSLLVTSRVTDDMFASCHMMQSKLVAFYSSPLKDIFFLISVSKKMAPTVAPTREHANDHLAKVGVERDGMFK